MIKQLSEMFVWSSKEDAFTLVKGAIETDNILYMTEQEYDSEEGMLLETTITLKDDHEIKVEQPLADVVRMLYGPKI